jgi:conflict system STAND superfamily ATPase
VTILASARMPYPGLRSFRREESDLFFGREDCINTMVDRLAETRFLAVLGSSGTGKSSVVKTGLLDALDLGVMAQAGSAWQVVDFRPGSTPLTNLARRLLESGKPGSGMVADAEVDLLRAFLVRGPRSIVEWCGDGHLGEHTNLLLLVDQFEELFRYQDYDSREEAEAFVALLLESARSRQFPIYVALTMRSEYLGACALVDGLAEAISAGMFLTPRMTREECRAAIVGPAKVCGVEIEEALVNRLLNDLAAFAPWDDRGRSDQLDRLIRRADQLPLLQYCLNRMWIRAQDGRASGGAVTLTLADYERIRGLAGALNAHADEILAGLGPDKLPVAEAVFRALTEGSTISDAVRRPTRLRDLAAIGAADAAAVRAVVDAYRAPGCNFLTPELDPANPRPLDAATVVDISHESLIRQWRKLSGWLELEARSVRQWRRLRDRFEDGQPMQGTELANMVAWRKEQKPNLAWARRYGGDFPAIIRFIETSERMRRRFAPAVMPLFALMALVIGFIIYGGAMEPIYGTQYPSWAWIPTLVLETEVAAITCGFGLWRYAGIDPRRAIVAGATIFFLNFGIGALSVAVAISHGVTSLVAMQRWEVLVSTPMTLIGLAIFDREFRNVFVSVPLIAIVSPPLGFIFLSGSVPDSARAWLAYLIAILWYAALGYQLRRGGGSIEDEGRRSRTSAPWALPILGLSTLVTLTLWEIGVWGLLFGSTPPSRTWPITVGIVAATTALTGAAGLWRYRSFGLARAAMAGLSILAVDGASAAALIGGLSALDVPEKIAGAWWGACLYAPCTLLVLAGFDRAFRRLPTLAVLAAAFCGPYGLMAWLNGSETLAMSDTTMTLLFMVIFSLWLAAIGRTLQQPVAGGSRRRLTEPQDEAGQDAAPMVAATPEATPAVA